MHATATLRITEVSQNQAERVTVEILTTLDPFALELAHAAAKSELGTAYRADGQMTARVTKREPIHA